MLKVAFLCVCIQLSNSSFTPSASIGQRWILVPEAAVVQLENSTAHYVSPPMNSDRGEEYVNEHPGPVNHPIYSCLQSQQASHSGEQYIPSTLPSFHDVSNFTLPSPSNTHHHVVDYNHEQTIAGIVNDGHQLRISLEQQMTLERLPGSGLELKGITFLAPHPDYEQWKTVESTSRELANSLRVRYGPGSSEIVVYFSQFFSPCLTPTSR